MLKPKGQKILEKRTLKRIKVGAAGDYRARIHLANRSVLASVEDFHFMGVKVKVSENEKIEFNAEIQKLEILYGNKTISEISNPEIIRRVNAATIILGLQPKSEVKGVRSKKRYKVKEQFKPIIIAKDPIKLGTALHFEVINFSVNGMLLKTSLSNRHILNGLEMRNAQILLPGLDIIKVHFRIVRISVLQQQLLVGVELIEAGSAELEAFARFALYGADVDANSASEKFASIKKDIVTIRQLLNSVRIEQVASLDDYAKVLKVRYDSYMAAGKLNSNASVEDMADEYDNRAIILVARTDQHIAATVRLVYSDSVSCKFPFEERIPFDSLFKGVVRSDLYEVSRLAVDPAFQGTDLVVKLFKEVARLTLIRGKTSVCLATRALQKVYSKLGFSKISDEFPHPVLSDEMLALMMVDSKEFVLGKNMSTLSWRHVAQEVVENLIYAEVLEIDECRASRQLGQNARRQDGRLSPLRLA